MASPQVINVSALDDPRDAVHRAVQGIAEGKTVVLPTETVYCVAASPLEPRSIERAQFIGLANRQPMLAIKGYDDARDYVPEMSPLAERLARRCWPGPLVLSLHDAHPDSVLKRLTPQGRNLVLHDERVQLTVPMNSLISSILRLLPGPLALWPACKAEGCEPVTAKDAIEQLGTTIDLVIDDGRTRFAQSPSVVEVTGSQAKLIRGSMISEATLKRFTGILIVTVCTGNTCRSPMAEVLLKKRLAERMKCAIDELEQRGVMVMSAGISAAAGARAAEEAVNTMKLRGLDLAMHEAQPFSERMVRNADLILTMTRSHREAILGHWPEARNRTFIISNERGDVSDPIGGSAELYRRCAEQIDSYLAEWAAKVELPSQ